MIRLKLDENFPSSLSEWLRQKGSDAESVFEENLSGADDEAIYFKCQEERRCLVTLDLDFSNIIRFPAENTPGIIVIRPNRPANLEVMKSMIELLLRALEQHDPAHCLWILEPHQLRIRKPKQGEKE
jgi:predicted nuclease of predicted toxin-antitoxin system